MRPWPAIALCAAALTGCGDDDDGRGRTTVVAAGQEVKVAGDEYSFDPSTVIVTGGSGRIVITLVNEGDLAHNLKVLDGTRELGGSPTFPGGQARSGAVELEPGDYRMVCTVGDHESLGMVGRLEVR